MGGIFISYRRQGAIVHARALFERLRHEFGLDNVFMDLEGIEYGVDFKDVVNRELSKCSVMLALIDPQWATATDKKGRRRLDQEDDFVRIEIATALARRIRTVPVLVDGTEMPDPETLPEVLRPLARLNALNLDFRRFDAEIGSLVAAIQRIRAEQAPQKTEERRPAPAPDRPSSERAYPAMVEIPGGEFMMGSPKDEVGRSDDEGPQHRVRILAFAMGRCPVTFEEWDACVTAGGCEHRPDDRGWGRGRRPVINVSWNDAQEYVRWLSKTTEQRYRLPTEAEWEYAVRAGGSGRFCFGNSEADVQQYAWFCANSEGRTHPVGQKLPNRFGLHDVHGNVWEWVEDVYRTSYKAREGDGSAWRGGGPILRTLLGDQRVVRGGGWSSSSDEVRSASRVGNSPSDRNSGLGFRVARS
jgi:formylglycine-generating enzyme required for sulfatase activity